MTATQLRRLLRGAPGDALVEVRVWYDEPEEWDGELRGGEFVKKRTSGRPTDVLFLDTGFSGEEEEQ